MQAQGDAARHLMSLAQRLFACITSPQIHRDHLSFCALALVHLFKAALAVPAAPAASVALFQAFVGHADVSLLDAHSFLLATHSACPIDGLPLVALLRAALSVVPALCFGDPDFSHRHVLPGQSKCAAACFSC